MNEIEKLEALLRKPPPLKIPRDLREKLQADVPVSIRSSETSRSPLAATKAQPPRSAGRTIASPGSSGFGSILKKWFLALCFSALFLACLVAIAVQSNLLVQLHRENENLKNANQNLDQLRQENLEYQKLRAENQQLERVRADNTELQNLRKEVVQLRQQAQELPALRSENQRLLSEKQAAESRIPRDAQREEDPFQAAQDKAQRIACISNLKQLGLAARMWSGDNKEHFPPDIISMSNELNTPKILVCPGDTNRPVARNWSEFTDANISYQFLSPGAPETDPSIVIFRCPLHNNVGLADGSAQMLGPTLGVVQKDGKWVISRISPTTPSQ